MAADPAGGGVRARRMTAPRFFNAFGRAILGSPLREGRQLHQHPGHGAVASCGDGSRLRIEDLHCSLRSDLGGNRRDFGSARSRLRQAPQVRLI